MPITLNHSNINVQYETGKNYNIETVKSDLYYVNNSNIINNIVSNNIQTAPVTPTTFIENGSNIYAIEAYTYTGTANTADYTRIFPKNTTCDILVVGGGGGGGNGNGGGGGSGQLILIHQATLNGSYTIKVGKGGVGGLNASTEPTKGINSEFGSVIAEGGGANGGTLKDGGSGAGGDGYSISGGTTGGGNKNTTIDTFPGATVYSRGNNGGNNGGTGGYAGGGGGGAGEAGSAGQDSLPYGKGGDGLSGISEINYDFKTKLGNYGKLESDGFYWFAAGGGGGGSFAGNGGKGGGGGGGSPNNTPGYDAINNTGSGGGGGGGNGNNVMGGKGGSGIVIIRYLVGTVPSNNLLINEPTVIAPAFTETIRTFSHSGGAEIQTTHTISVGRDTVCDILIVGGGGGGGSRHAGGGGAGAVIYLSNQTFLAGTYTILVGKGGTGASTMGQGTKGGDSSISFNSTNIYLAKGGGAGHHDAGTGNSNKDGGSGAGSGGQTIGYPVSTNIPPGIYGNTGGYLISYNGGGGGGGGALTSGTNGTDTVGGNGGAGISISITGTAVTYGGGGGGGSLAGYTPGTGGVGGGGNGSQSTSTASSGTAGTGGGGGGGGFWDSYNGPGGAGGSGIVIIKFKYPVASIFEGITHKRLNFAYDLTRYTEYLAQLKTGVGGWRIVRYLPPTATTWYQGDYINTSTFNIPTIGTPYNYTNEWAVSFGTFDEMFFGTFNMNYWLRCLKTSVLGTYTNSARPIISSSFSSTPYNANWYNRGTGEDPLISIQNFPTQVVYREQLAGHFELVSIDGGMCVLVRDSTASTTISNPNQYTLNFPVPTIADINNNSNIVLQGTYDISLSSTNASIIPKTNQYIPKPTTFSTSNISLRYHLLNPTLDPIGAQWTYSSNNTNVYHMGSVGIGTTSPEYSLDVRGTIFSSTGGYTQTGLTTWSITSDRRIKENIVKASYEKCLENVKNIELYNFNFKDNYVNTNDRRQLGFIAQDVQRVYPKAVEVGKMIMKNNDGIENILSLNTTQIEYTLYGAVKKLIGNIEEMENEIEEIENTSNITTQA